MIKTLKMINKVDNSISANTLLFNIKKIPLLSNLFRDSLYKAGKSKNILFNIVKLLAFIMEIFKKFLYFIIFYYFALTLLREDFNLSYIFTEEYRLLVINIYFFTNIILGGILKFQIRPLYNNYSYTCLNYLGLNPREYFISRGFFNYLIFFIAMIIPMLIFGKTIGLPTINIWILLLETLLFRIFIDGTSLYIFDRKDENRKKVHWFFTMFLAIVLLALAYGPLYLLDSMTYVNLLFHPISLAIFILLGLVGLYMISKYDNYKSLKKAELKIDSDVLEAKNNTNKKKMVLEEKDLDMTGNKYLSNKEGYDYLNSIFMTRYSKIFSKRAKKISLAAFVIPVLIGLVSYFLPGEEDKIAIDLYSKLGIWFFLIYLMAFKDKYSYALFNNIDRSLLPHNWYRKPEAILTSFKLRLKTSFLLNASMTLSLMVGLFILSLFLGLTIIDILPLFALIILLTLFYSTHYLTLYYLVQPYTENSDVKSPIYSFFNFMVYMVSYSLMQKGDLSILGLGIIASVVVIYLLLSIVLIKYKAAETFKIRE